ncbi:MAG: NfeD family protein [Ruminococcus sp.]|nr:NfeD family protein [Ruminococcus sp.]
MSIFWLILAVVMFVLEATTAQLVSIWFALGAVGGCITSLFTDVLWIQIVVAVLVTLITLLVTRPLAKRLTQVKLTHTNSDKYIGKDGVVTIAIDNVSATGQVKVGYSVWSAKSADGNVIEKDSKLVVKAIEGAKLVVETVK